MTRGHGDAGDGVKAIQVDGYEVNSESPSGREGAVYPRKWKGSHLTLDILDIGHLSFLMSFHLSGLRLPVSPRPLFPDRTYL